MVGDTTKKPSKYNNNKPTYYDPEIKETLTFDSNKELEYYLLLKDREKRGEITDLERQVTFNILPDFTDRVGKKHKAINYIADFFYKDLTPSKYGYHVIDVKGYKTEVYRIKKKLLAYKGLIIEEV